jgi:putative endonuclease
MYNKRSVGTQYEQLAVKYLIKQGYEIILQNFACRSGEIDIIAKEKGYLVFVEVKFRTNISKGFPQEAVDVRKIKKITRTARYYMHSNSIAEDTPCRFDVVTILDQDIALLQNAFEAIQ